MGILLTDIETELKNRLRPLGIGANPSATTIARLRYAIRKGAKQAWEKQDWDFKNSTATLTTTAGNQGPYALPAGLVRLATFQMFAAFGFQDKDVLAPIYSDGDTERVRPYIRVQDGKLYFIDDPGSASLTLNYLGVFSNSIVEADLTATLAQIDAGLQDSIVTLATADLWKDLPGNSVESHNKEMEGFAQVDQYWEEVTRDKYQKTIAPRGLNKISVDFVARVITVLGWSLQRTPNVR